MSRSELVPCFACMVTVSPGCAMALPGIVAVALPTWSFQPVRMIGSPAMFLRLIQGVASPSEAAVMVTRATGTAGLGLAAAAAPGEADARGEVAAVGLRLASRVGAAVGLAAGAVAPQADRRTSDPTTRPRETTRRVDRYMDEASRNAMSTPFSIR